MFGIYYIEFCILFDFCFLLFVFLLTIQTPPSQKTPAGDNQD